jgi:hypothetical protein
MTTITLLVDDAELPEFATEDVYPLSTGRLYDAILGIAAKGNQLRKQDNNYKDIMGRDRERQGGFETAMPTRLPALDTAAPKMTQKSLPENVLDFTVPFAAPTAPRPGRS